MALREIVNKKEEILRKKSRPVEKFDERLHELLNDMKDTLHHANGVGLAAPQVGVLRRVVVIEILPNEGEEGEGQYFEMVNPSFLKKEGKQMDYEGCLSCPNEYGITTRPAYVKVEAYDRYGKRYTAEGEGLLARAFCHEIDHLDGILFIDHATMIDNENIIKDDE